VNLAEHLAVPYRLTTYAAPTDEGWKRFAEYPEIDLRTYADTLMEAMDRLEEARIDFIVERLAHGDAIPVPRPPLRSLMAELPPERLREIEGRLTAAANGPGR
jgi:predicted RNase H-like HicB family nuclease